MDKLNYYLLNRHLYHKNLGKNIDEMIMRYLREENIFKIFLLRKKINSFIKNSKQLFFYSNNI